MSKEFVQRVLTWNEAAGRTDNEFNVRAVSLHLGLQAEELGEKFEALGLNVYAEEMKNIADAFKQGEHNSCIQCADSTALLDADCDIMVVTVGAMMSSGADVQGALDEVCRSNESKGVCCIACSGSGVTQFDGDACVCETCDGRGWILTKDANGKIQKSSFYVAPNLDPFVHKDCGKVNSGHACTMKKGSECPDCSGIRGETIGTQD